MGCNFGEVNYIRRHFEIVGVIPSDVATDAVEAKISLRSSQATVTADQALFCKIRISDSSDGVALEAVESDEVRHWLKCVEVFPSDAHTIAAINEPRDDLGQCQV